MLSVPDTEIVPRCGETPPESGSILDPSVSCRGYQDYRELELSAFMFTRPDYLLGIISLPIPSR
ncbi:MAG: hypothetical protein WCW52_09480 [Elusimicrobiales bacterium]